VVTKESFVSICWRLIPYWLNSWEQVRAQDVGMDVTSSACLSETMLQMKPPHHQYSPAAGTGLIAVPDKRSLTSVCSRVEP